MRGHCKYPQCNRYMPKSLGHQAASLSPFELRAALPMILEDLPLYYLAYLASFFSFGFS